MAPKFQLGMKKNSLKESLLSSLILMTTGNCFLRV